MNASLGDSQPVNLTVVKTVQRSLTIAEVYAVDESGNVWRMTQGMDENWKLFMTAEEAAKA